MYRVHNVCVLVSCCKGASLLPLLQLSVAEWSEVCVVFAQLSTWPPLLIRVCVCARHCRVPEVELRLRVGLVVQYFSWECYLVYFISFLVPSPFFFFV